MRRVLFSDIASLLRRYLAGVFVVAFTLYGICGIATSGYTYAYSQTRSFQDNKRTILAMVAAASILWPLWGIPLLRLVSHDRLKQK